MDITLIRLLSEDRQSCVISVDRCYLRISLGNKTAEHAATQIIKGLSLSSCRACYHYTFIFQISSQISKVKRIRIQKKKVGGVLQQPSPLSMASMKTPPQWGSTQYRRRYRSCPYIIERREWDISYSFLLV